MRGALAGSVTTFLALAFHVFGGGAVPDAVAIVGSLLAAIWICTMLAGRRMRAWLLAVAIAAAQVVLHTVFSIATATAAPAPAASGHAHGPAMAGDGHGDAVIGAITHAGHAMWAAHVAAGVVTVLGILFGDRVLTGIVGLGSRIVARVLVAVLAPTPVASTRVPLPVAPIILTLADRAVSLVARRGPPAFVTV